MSAPSVDLGCLLSLQLVKEFLLLLWDAGLALPVCSTVHERILFPADFSHLYRDLEICVVDQFVAEINVYTWGIPP